MGRLDDIKRARDARMQTEHLTLPIPTWSGDLAARYRVLGEDDIKNAHGEAVDADIDFLARACIQILMRDDNGLEPLEHEGLPVAYDANLGELLDIPEHARGSTRGIVRHLFGNNPIAIDQHTRKVLDWMRDTSLEVEGAIVGESVTTRSSSSPDGRARSVSTAGVS